MRQPPSPVRSDPSQRVHRNKDGKIDPEIGALDQESSQTHVPATIAAGKLRKARAQFGAPTTPAPSDSDKLPESLGHVEHKMSIRGYLSFHGCEVQPDKLVIRHDRRKSSPPLPALGTDGITPATHTLLHVRQALPYA